MTLKINNNEILEALGFTIVKGLKNPKGGDLGDFQVPNLAAIPLLRLQDEMLAFNMSLLSSALVETGLGETKEEIAKKLADMPPKESAKRVKDILSVVLDGSGLDMMIKILITVFRCDEEMLNLTFDGESLQKVYVEVLKRDFPPEATATNLQKRLPHLLGSDKEEENPPKVEANST